LLLEDDCLQLKH